SLIVTCGFAAAYPFLTHVWLLMALGTLEAVGVAISAPAAQSMLSQTVSADALGRVQGVYTTTQTAALSLAAAVSGAMFAAARWLPFASAAAVGVGLSLTLPWWWRSMPPRATPGEHVPPLAGAGVAMAGSPSPSVRPD